MRKSHILILRHANGFDAHIAGLTAGITNAESEAEAIGRLILLLSHPLGIKIERETTEEN